MEIYKILYYNVQGCAESAYCQNTCMIRGAIPAFLGNVVEKDIHKSSLIATICFAGGMAGTGFFIWYGGLNQHSVLALVGIYVCYGFIMGIGLGTGYLSPVKTLMLWFEDRKGLATGLTIITNGIKNPYVDGTSSILLIIIVLCLLFVVNAGYGGGFSNVPNLLSDHYGMSNISAIHGITLSAWAIAGLTGNQMANAIVNAVANKHPELLREVEYHGEMITVNPVGYQTVLYVTGALYVVSLLLSIFLVRPSEAALAAKKAGK